MVALVSGRGGSKSERMPTYSHLGEAAPARFTATPSERKPRSASSCTCASTRALSAAASCAMGRIMCGAPLATCSSAPERASSRSTRTRLLVGLKGSKCSSRQCAYSARRASGTASQMHLSMASCTPASRREQSEARKVTSASSTAASSSTGAFSASWLSVSVPVLSLHRMVMPASSSMALRRATMTRRLASMCEPTASVEVQTTSMAMGMEATRMTMTTESAPTAFPCEPASLMWRGSSCAVMSLAKMAAHSTTEMPSRPAVMRSSTACRWPCPSTLSMSAAAVPRKVRVPVAVTMASPSPRLTAEPILRCPHWCTVTGRLSPVSAAWSTSTESRSTSTASAGTTSPSLSLMRSPGTSSVASRDAHAPARHT